MRCEQQDQVLLRQMLPSPRGQGGRTSRLAGISLMLFMMLLACTQMAQAVTFFAVRAGNLVSYDTTAPATPLATVAFSGLQGGEFIRGIDFRPATGELYGVGSTSRLYRINTTTGACTIVGAPLPITIGASSGFDKRHRHLTAILVVKQVQQTTFDHSTKYQTQLLERGSTLKLWPLSAVSVFCG